MSPPAGINVAIIGLGLIGGSFGLAVRRAGIALRVIGFDASRSALDSALDRGAIDAAAGDLDEAIAGADLIFIATPVGEVGPVFERISALLEPQTFVTDAGSTKTEILRRIESMQNAGQFVGGHPFAGREKGGIEAASEDLFDGAVWFLTPSSSTTSQARESISGILKKLGAHVLSITPDRHDELMAATSHLPQLISTVLSAVVQSTSPSDVPLVAGPGLRDMTRLSASPSHIWLDVLRDNRIPILRVLASFGERISSLSTAIENEDWDAVREVMEVGASASARIGLSNPADAR